VTPFRRNIPLLAFAQAMMMSNNSLMITASALVGYGLSEDKSLATLPLAAGFVAVMLSSIPAAWLMHHIGRKAGFLLAILIGMGGAALAAWAILHQYFWGFVAASAMTGVHNGFGTYYRFAAADTVTAELKGRAVSYILAGGVVAAFVGPNLANISRDWIGGAPFAASFAVVMGLYLCSGIALSLLKLPAQAEDHVDLSEPVRPLREIARQPAYRTALICGALGYGVMSLVMTATPLAMSHHAHGMPDTSFVIQWHVLAMFAPSFFTGRLIEAWGMQRILLIGAGFGVLCVVTNLAGTSLWHFWMALVLLGLSWNFLFIGATTLLTSCYRPAEKARVQASNDFTVFTAVTLSSLSAGALQHRLGWQMVNIGVLPLLAVILFSLYRFSRLQEKFSE
jgi:MFS family permease